MHFFTNKIKQNGSAAVTIQGRFLIHFWGWRQNRGYYSRAAGLYLRAVSNWDFMVSWNCCRSHNVDVQGQSSQNVKSKSGIFHTLMLLLLSFFMSECSLVAAFWYSEVIWDTSNTQVLYFTFKVKMTNFFLNLLMWVIKLDFFYLPFLTLLFNLDVILEL